MTDDTRPDQPPAPWQAPQGTWSPHPGAAPGPWVAAPPPTRGNGLVIGIIVGVIGVVVVVPVLLIMAVVLLGRSADSEFRQVGVAIDPDGGTIPIGPDDGFTPIEPEPTDPSSEPEPPTEREPGLHPFCPSAAEVADALGRSLPSATEERAVTRLSINDVELTVEICEYGGTVDVGHIVGEGADTAIEDLSASRGRFGTAGTTLDVRSVRVILPGGVDGSERLVFEHDGQVMTVARNGATWDEVAALAELVLSRPAPG